MIDQVHDLRGRSFVAATLCGATQANRGHRVHAVANGKGFCAITPAAHSRGWREAARRVDCPNCLRSLRVKPAGHPQSRDFEIVLEAVSRELHVPAEALLSRLNTRRVSTCRQIWMFLLREVLSCLFPWLGVWFGRDPTTALHARDQIRTRMSGRAFALQMDRLK